MTFLVIINMLCLCQCPPAFFGDNIFSSFFGGGGGGGTFGREQYGRSGKNIVARVS